jgi:hypothetical protein
VIATAGMKELEAQFRRVKAAVESEIKEKLGDGEETHSEDVKLEQRIDPVAKPSKAVPWK